MGNTEDVYNFIVYYNVVVYLVQALATSPDLTLHASVTEGQQPSDLFASLVQVSLQTVPSILHILDFENYVKERHNK
jgi:hypothetical protein